MSRPVGLLAAANHLRYLLNTNPNYRKIWLAKADRVGGSPNVDAVSRVLVDYHWSHEHLFSWKNPEHHRSYKDRVSRALEAKALTLSTIRLFVLSFGMSPDDEHELIRLLDRGAIQSGGGGGCEPESVLAMLRAERPSRPYETIGLHELHTVGRDRLPVNHRTIHTIRALEDGVDTHLYVFDTPDVSVRAVSGASAGPILPFTQLEGYWVTELRFNRPLRKGQIRFFEYITEFRYSECPPPEMRRATNFAMELLSMRVSFHPDQRPQSIGWYEWNGLDGPATLVTDVQMDEDSAVCEIVNSPPPGRSLGFLWDWA